MAEKHKPQVRLRQFIFLAGWVAISIIWWIFNLLNFYEMTWFLPLNVRYFFRNNLPIGIRSYITLMIDIGIGIAIPAVQRYWLNRTFGLRLSWWWVVLTFLGYMMWFPLFNPLWYLLRDFPPIIMVSIIYNYIAPAVYPALLQWWMLRKRWKQAWLWIVVSVIAICVAFQLWILFLSFDADFLYLDYRHALETIPSGLAYGLLTGITALYLDWRTRRVAEKTKTFVA